MGPSSEEEEGVWLMGAAWDFGAQRAELHAAQAELSTIALSLHAISMGLPMGASAHSVWGTDCKQGQENLS